MSHGYKTLSEGEKVSFNLIKTDKGLQAQNVYPLGIVVLQTT